MTTQAEKKKIFFCLFQKTKARADPTIWLVHFVYKLFVLDNVGSRLWARSASSQSYLITLQLNCLFFHFSTTATRVQIAIPLLGVDIGRLLSRVIIKQLIVNTGHVCGGRRRRG
jgi:hypothetical protein